MHNNLLMYYALSFSAVVKAGGFTQASKKSGLSKAQLSRHVQLLEDLLGVPLLLRSTRSMALTEQGKQFFTSCEAIENDCEEAVSNVKDAFSKMQGTFKITAPIDFGIQFLPSIIHSFSQRYPDMNVILSLSNENENLTVGQFDLAIRIANQLPDSSLHSRLIFKFKRVICAASSYLANQTKPRTIQDLKNHLCITSVNRNRDVLCPQWQFQHDKKTQNVRLEKFIEVDSLFAQLNLLKMGTGIGRMPSYFIKNELESGELVELFANIKKPDTCVYLLYPESKIIARKTRIFIDFMLESINHKI